jgi:hypothetical protein
MTNRKDEARIKEISEFMTEKLYSHEYYITREDARQIGLSIKRMAEVEKLMWELYLEYEELMGLREPWNQEKELGNQQSKNLQVVRAATEIELTRGQTLPQVQIQNLPQNIPPQAVQQLVQQILAQLQPQVTQGVRQRVVSEGWRRV